MNCDTIVAEIEANNNRIRALVEEEGWKVAQNVAAGVGGILIPALWFGRDFQDAAGKEAQAYSQRNQYLSKLAANKCAGYVPPAKKT